MLSPATRHLLQLNLDHSLVLWLEAIAAGDYALAQRLLDWRVEVKAALAGPC